MVATNPEITRTGNRIHRRLGHVIGFIGLLDRIRKKTIKIGIVKAQKIEIEILFLQSRKLGCQHFFVPAGIKRNLVVCDHHRASLNRCQMREYNDRYFGQAKLLCSHNPPMACNQNTVITDENRVDEAKFRNRSGDLCHLLIGMGACVARMRDQAIEWPMLDARVEFLGHSGCFSLIGSDGNWHGVPGGITCRGYHPDYSIKA